MTIYANEEGVYAYTITGNEDIEVYAEFELIPEEPETSEGESGGSATGKSCKSSVTAGGLLGLLALPAVLFFARKSKKED